MMATVGLSLGADDFRRLIRRPKIVLIAIGAQWLLLPPAAWTLAWVLPLPPDLTAGIILLAACPAGAVSNFFCYLARADVALSVSLTAMSLVTSILMLPFLAGVGFKLLTSSNSSIEMPVTNIVSQLLVAVLIPVVIGMAVRHRNEKWVTDHEPSIRRASNVVLLTTVLLLVVNLRSSLADDFGVMLVASTLFVVTATVVGAAVGQMANCDRQQKITVTIEFGCRNTAIAMLIGLASFGRPRLAAFSLVVFLTQIPIMLGGIAVAKLWARSQRSFNGDAP
jgi:BASS family bile acid:Na+ symporter